MNFITGAGIYAGDQFLRCFGFRYQSVGLKPDRVRVFYTWHKCQAYLFFNPFSHALFKPREKELEASKNFENFCKLLSNYKNFQDSGGCSSLIDLALKDRATD